jgi:hypothetical protein
MANRSIALTGVALGPGMDEAVIIEKMKVTEFERFGDDLQATFTSSDTGHDGIRVEVCVPWVERQLWIDALTTLDTEKEERTGTDGCPDCGSDVPVESYRETSEEHIFEAACSKCGVHMYVVDFEAEAADVQKEE